MKRVFWCNIKYGCFGFVSENNLIKEAPPIFAWAIGKTLQDIKPFLLSKNAKVIELK